MGRPVNPFFKNGAQRALKQAYQTLADKIGTGPVVALALVVIGVDGPRERALGTLIGEGVVDPKTCQRNRVVALRAASRELDRLANEAEFGEVPVVGETPA